MSTLSELKYMWAGPRPVIGTGLSLGSLRAAEFLATTAFDYVMVDTMHGHFDKAGATDAIRSLVRSGPPPIARVSENSAGAINDMLDAGAVGIVVPMVESSEAAESAVRSTFYPPIGTRSKGSVAPVIHGPRYVMNANDMISLIVMIETPEAAACAPRILAVPGVTCCLIGASDLQFVMGVERDDPGFLEAVDLVVAAGTEHGVAVGISVTSADEIPTWCHRGVSFFLASHDLALFGTAVRKYDRSFEDVRSLSVSTTSNPSVS